MEWWPEFAFILRAPQSHIVCMDSQYWHGLMKQTVDGHCLESDGKFRGEVLLSGGMGRRCSSGPVSIMPMSIQLCHEADCSSHQGNGYCLSSLELGPLTWPDVTIFGFISRNVSFHSLAFLKEKCVR